MAARACSKCRGNMECETRLIPREIPLPLPLNPTVSIDQYLPNPMKKYSNYTVFIYQSRGSLEVFLS